MVGPRIVPLPEMAQLWDALGGMATELYMLVEPGQTGIGPVMEQLGLVLTTRSAQQTAVSPAESVLVAQYVPATPTVMMLVPVAVNPFGPPQTTLVKGGVPPLGIFVKLCM